MKIKALIVDDEPLSRDELKYLLSKHETIEIVGEAKDGGEALKLTGQIEPDVVFLDINMPGMSGIEVAKLLTNFRKQPRIVFATAYDEHAIEAFEINAVDYLLKPFSAERVTETIKRLDETKYNTKDKLENLAQSINQFKKILVNVEGSVKLIQLKDVIYFYSEGKNIFLQTDNHFYRLSQTMAELEDKLPKPPFFRCHRGYIVNLEYVEELHPWFNGAYQVVVKDNKRTKLPVSRLAVKELKELIEL